MCLTSCLTTFDPPINNVIVEFCAQIPYSEKSQNGSAQLSTEVFIYLARFPCDSTIFLLLLLPPSLLLLLERNT